MSLLFLTFILGVLSILIIKFLTKRWLTPNTLYWAAWLLAISCVEFSAWGGVLPKLGPLASRLIFQSHLGAFAGFILASYFLLVTGKRLNNKEVRILPFIFPKKLLRDISIFYVSVAILHLAYRISLLEGVNEFVYYTIRQDFLSLRDPFRVTQFSSISFSLVPFIFALLAAEDRFDNSIRLKRLLPIFFAAVLHGLAMGGRLWMAMPIGYYLFSYTLLKLNDQPLQLRSLVRKFAQPFLIIILLFIVLGSLRSDNLSRSTNLAYGKSWYQRSDGVMSPIAYIGVAPASLELTSRFAAQIKPLNGQLLMPWFARRLDDLGLLTRYMDQELVMRRDEVRAIDHRVAATQCTVLCLVVGDFGVDSIAYVMGFLMASCQFFALVLVGKGYIRHAIASTLTAATFLTIQDGWFGIPLNAVGIIGVVVLRWFIIKYIEREKLLEQRKELKRNLVSKLKVKTTISTG